jgi:hypothetical protein
LKLAFFGGSAVDLELNFDTFRSTNTKTVEGYSTSSTTSMRGAQIVHVANSAVVVQFAAPLSLYPHTYCKHADGVVLEKHHQV